MVNATSSYHLPVNGWSTVPGAAIIQDGYTYGHAAHRFGYTYIP